MTVKEYPAEVKMDLREAEPDPRMRDFIEDGEDDAICRRLDNNLDLEESAEGQMRLGNKQ